MPRESRAPLREGSVRDCLLSIFDSPSSPMPARKEQREERAAEEAQHQDQPRVQLSSSRYQRLRSQLQRDRWILGLTPFSTAQRLLQQQAAHLLEGGQKYWLAPQSRRGCILC